MNDTSDTATTLADVRRRIDLIDAKIIELIASRQQWVLAAGNLKKDETAVRAPGRVNEVIATVRARAAQAGASPEVVEQTYRALIAAFIELELAHHRAR